MRLIVTVSLALRLWVLTNFLVQERWRNIHRILPFFSLGMSVLIGSGRPSAIIVISLPFWFLVEPPKASGGKKTLPHGLMFRLPYL
ncbi:hypothetical protein ES703_117533 [subsurface metagenome]